MVAAWVFAGGAWRLVTRELFDDEFEAWTTCLLLWPFMVIGVALDAWLDRQ